MGDPILCTAVVVRRDDGRILMLRRHREDGYDPYDGHWCLPGGSMEDGETAARCAFRELREETGIISNLLPMGFTDHLRGDCRQIGLIFMAYIWGGVPINREPHRHNAIDWVDVKNPRYPMMPGAAEVVGWLKKGE